MTHGLVEVPRKIYVNLLMHEHLSRTNYSGGLYYFMSSQTVDSAVTDSPMVSADNVYVSARMDDKFMLSDISFGINNVSKVSLLYTD